MDLYDSDASIEIIRKKIPFVKTDLGEDTNFYHEIFVTAYALAFWEIGEMTDDILNAVKETIELKAGVKVWSQEVSEAEGRKRQKELDRLWNKISRPNTKARKRKKYKPISQFYFQVDDLIVFQTKDGNYHAVVCANITQYRGQCTYDLVATTYTDKKKPIRKDLLNCFIAGRRIGSGYSPEVTLAYQPNVNEIWEYNGKETNFFFGVKYYLITHKDLIHFRERFEIVDKLEIKASFKKSGGYGYESSFERFEEIFSDFNQHMRTFQLGEYPVQLLCVT